MILKKKKTTTLHSREIIIEKGKPGIKLMIPGFVFNQTIKTIYLALGA